MSCEYLTVINAAFKCYRHYRKYELPTSDYETRIYNDSDST